MKMLYIFGCWTAKIDRRFKVDLLLFGKEKNSAIYIRLLWKWRRNLFKIQNAVLDQLLALFTFLFLIFTLLNYFQHRFPIGLGEK